MRLRSRAWLLLVLLVVLLFPVAVPVIAAPRPALADTWIAFTSLASGEEGIWLVHPNGSGLRRLTEGRDVYASWSPDGTKLAYVHELTGTLSSGNPISYTSEIRIVNTSGRILFTVRPSDWVSGQSAQPAQGNTGAPQWSPDGQALTFGVDLRRSFVQGWGGRRTFYLTPPRLEISTGPDGDFYAGGTLMLDQTWGPGQVPTWVRVGVELGSCQLLAYDQTVLSSDSEIYFNPSWSPDGQSLTVYRQVSKGTRFNNALLQVSAAGQVERTLFESEELVLYNVAEWSPDGQQQLVGISTDLAAWYWEVVLAMEGPSGGPKNIALLPKSPPPEGYLYVLEQAGGKVLVTLSLEGTIDLISRQPWSPDGTQVVFMRATPPGTSTAIEGLGIYAGPPGQVSLIVPFVSLGPGLELSMAYPAWQPAPQGPLPTMVPLGPYAPAATMLPTQGPTVPPTASPTVRPTATKRPTAAVTITPRPTSTPVPTVAPQPTPLRIDPQVLLLVGEILLAVVLVAVIIWVIQRRRRPTDGTAPREPSRSFQDWLKQKLPFLHRPPADDTSTRGFRLFRRRPRQEETTVSQEPKRRSGLLKRRPRKESAAPPKVVPPAAAADTAEPAPPPERPSRAEPAPWPEPDGRAHEAAVPGPEPASGAAEPEVTFPSVGARRTEGVAWLSTDTRPEMEMPTPPELPEEEPAAPLPEPEIAPFPSAPAAVRPVQELLQEGVAQVKAGNAPAGFALLRQVVERAPEEGEAWLWLGWAAVSQEQRDLAEKCFLRAQRLGCADQATQALAWLKKR